MPINTNPLTILMTPWFIASFSGWMVAQLVKMLISLIRTRRLDFAYLVSTGGMPSAHSAMVSGLAASIGLTEGFDSPVAVLAAGFAAITMFDAAVVRRAAGNQARILNQMMRDIFVQHKFTAQPLRELLGHTRLEVFAGMLTGIMCAVIICKWSLFQ